MRIEYTPNHVICTKGHLVEIFDRVLAKITDLDTGEEIPYCTMADEEAGECEVVVLTDGKMTADENGNIRRERMRRRIKIEVTAVQDRRE